MLYKAVALDPGGTTGWATFSQVPSDDYEFDCGHLGPKDHQLLLWRFLIQEGPDVVICENFTYRPHLPHAELISKEYIGVAKLWCQVYEKKLMLQPVMKDGNSFVKDDLLKKMGLWCPGMPHAMDAYRQLLSFLIIRENRRDLLPRPKKA